MRANSNLTRNPDLGILVALCPNSALLPSITHWYRASRGSALSVQCARPVASGKSSPLSMARCSSGRQSTSANQPTNAFRLPNGEAENFKLGHYLQPQPIITAMFAA